MRTIYEAYDGTQFERADDCFDYEWREYFPNIRIFNNLGRALSTVANLDAFENIFKVNSPEEKQLVMKYLTTFYGDIGFSELWSNEYSNTDGYILEASEMISYMSPAALYDYYNGHLTNDTDLMTELLEEKA